MENQKLINELGAKALVKIQRKKEKEQKFSIVATKLVELTQQACLNGKPCYFIIWLDNGVAKEIGRAHV